ncbi:MAG: hypothetical protein WAV72_31180 [Bradyrhizobium sp.]
MKLRTVLTTASSSSLSTDGKGAVQPMSARSAFPADAEPNLTVDASGKPGIPPTWTSSSKDAVGGSLGPSRLWFTLGYGIVNEVYWPRIDIPQIRDLGFIVADGKGFWSEVKRNGDYSIRAIAPGVPAFEIVHTHSRYVLRLRVSPDPQRDVLSIECDLQSSDPDMRLCVLLAPHLGATGHDNRAIVARHHGRHVLWAEHAPFALALAAVTESQEDAILRAGCGYVGVTDGWQDFARNGAMTWENPAAGPGNVALMAELSGRCVLALGFASSREAASTLAVSSLLQPFDSLLGSQVADWRAWHNRCAECCARPHGAAADLEEQFVVSATVLRTHLDKTYPGAMVASLSIPWGDSGNERGGYHLVCGRAISSNAPVRCLLSEAKVKHAIPCVISLRRKIPKAIGTRINGLAAIPRGPVFSSTRSPFWCCLPAPWPSAMRSAASAPKT